MVSRSPRFLILSALLVVAAFVVGPLADAGESMRRAAAAPVHAPRPKATSTPASTPTPTAFVPAATSTPSRTATGVPSSVPTQTPTTVATSPPGAGAEPVVWTNLVNVTASGNTIQKTGGVAYRFDAGANSQQRLLSGDGYVEVTVDNAPEQVYSVFGLSSTNLNASEKDIQFGIYMAGWTLRVYELYADRGSFGMYRAGDVLRVAVESGRVSYYRNGVKFYTSTVAPSYPLFVDSSIADPQVRILNAMFHSGAPSTPAGIASSTPTRTATWTATARAGTHTPAATSTAAWTPTHTATAAPTVTAAGGPEPVVWTNLVNVTASGNTIQKTGGVAYRFDAGANSQQRLLSGDGYVEVTVDNAPEQVYSVFGLSSTNLNASEKDIQFGIYMAGWTLRVYELYADRGSFGMYRAGDVLRVAVESGRVSYYRNGVKFYTSTVAPSYPLFVDSSIADPRVRILNAKIQIGTPPTVPPATATAQALVGWPPPPINCQMFPMNNIWNKDISGLPVHAKSAAYITKIGSATPLHADFTSQLWQGETHGGFYELVSSIQPRVPIGFTDYAGESDPGPYPVPPDARIQGGPHSNGDRHVLTLDSDNCVLYELYKAYPQADGSWQAGSGAVWDLKSNALRANGWTSADAAGFAILPGLVRYDEIERGRITHAIRFTALMSSISSSWVWPARHSDGESIDPNAPPMGSRLRLKAGVDISSYPARVQVILRALKQYGMILADSGGGLNISGTVDPRWHDGELYLLGQLLASDFEVVDQAGLMVDANSGASR